MQFQNKTNLERQSFQQNDKHNKNNNLLQSQKQQVNPVITGCLQNVMDINLMDKSFKCLTYQCRFIKTGQTVEIKLIDMSQIYWVIDYEIFGLQINVREQLENIAFWNLEDEKRAIQIGQSHINNPNQILNSNQKQTIQVSYKNKSNNNSNKILKNIKFQRFLFQNALTKLQLFPSNRNITSKDLKDLRSYFYGADGVLYNNLIIYSKVFQSSLLQVANQEPFIYDSIKGKIINQFLNMHDRDIIYTKVNMDKIMLTSDVERICKRKATNDENSFLDYSKDKHFTPLITIDEQVTPLSSFDKSTQKKLQKQSVEMIENMLKNLQNLFQSLKNQHFQDQPSSASSEKMSHISIKNSYEQQFKKIQKYLQLPRAYILMQKCNNIQKFQKQLLKVKKFRLTEAQLVWYVQKYHIIQNSFVRSNSKQWKNGNSSSPCSSKKKLLKCQQIRKNQKNIIHNIFQQKNVQIICLQKQYSSLQQQRFIPNLQYLNHLGWGQLLIRYYQNQKYTQNKNIYIQNLLKYVLKLQKYYHFRKLRKFYHFYNSRLLQFYGRINQAIFQLYKALKIANIQYSITSVDVNVNKVGNQEKSEIQAGTLYHELARLNTKIKNYRQAIVYFDKCLRTKCKLYGNFSLNLLPTLYNIIYIFLKHFPNDNKSQFKQYIFMLSAIKDKIINEKQLEYWINIPSNNMSISLIAQVQKQLTNLYDDPWREMLAKLMASKLQGNTILKKTYEEDRGLKIIPKIIHSSQHSIKKQHYQVGYYCEHKLITQWFGKLILLQKNQTTFLQKQNQCKIIIQDISKYGCSCLSTKMHILTHILKYHIEFLMSQQESLSQILKYVNSLKSLLQSLQEQSYNSCDNRQSRQKNELEFGLRQIIYKAYKTIAKYKSLSDEEWQWIYKSYYEWNNQKGFIKIKQMHIANIIEYCLILNKYNKDYGRVYNLLTKNQHNIKKVNIQNDQIVNNCQNSIQQKILQYCPFDKQMLWRKVFYVYLISISLLHMRKYKQAINILQQLLKLLNSQTISKLFNIENDQSKWEMQRMCSLLQKQTLYLQEFIHILLFAYYQIRDYENYQKLFQKQILNNILQNQIYHVNYQSYQTYQQQLTIIVKMAVEVCYLKSATTKQSIIQYALQIMKLMPKSPNCTILKILSQNIQHLLRYLMQIFDIRTAKNNNTKQNNRQRHKNKKLTKAHSQLIQLYNQIDTYQNQSPYQFYKLAVSLLIQFIENLNQTDIYFGDVCQFLVYRILPPLFTNELLSKMQLSRLADRPNPIKNQILIPDGLSDDLVGKIIDFLQNFKAKFYIRSIQNIQDNQFIDFQHVPNQQRIWLKNMFDYIVNNWVPKMISFIESQQQKAQTQNPIQFRINRRQKLKNPQLTKIFNFVLLWLRSKNMFKEVVICQILLKTTSKIRFKYSADFKPCSQQTQEIRKLLLYFQRDQRFITQTNLSNQLQFIPIIPILAQNLQQITNLRKKIIKFVQQHNQIIKNAADSHLEDLDAHLFRLQKQLDKLQILKFDLQNYLPIFYIEWMEQNFIDKIRDQIEMW